MDDDASSIASNVSTTSTTASERIPDLTQDHSEISSEVSAKTDFADQLMGDGYLLEDHDGVLILPDRHRPDAELLCPFQILDCYEIFADIPAFKTHVFSHFRGGPLPTKATCFLCDKKYTQQPEDDQALAWNNMLSHMSHEHFRRGETLATVRPDFGLMRWMFNRRMISVSQFKRTQLMPTPVLLPNGAGRRPDVVNAPVPPIAPSATPPSISSRNVPSRVYDFEPFTVSHSRRTERRRMNATRGASVRAWSYM